MQITDYIKKDNARTISGTLRPSGRFSVCQIFPKKCTGAKYAKVQEQKVESVRDVPDLDTSYRAMLEGHWVDLQSVSIPNQSIGGAIGLSIATNSNIPARRGSRGITSRQRDLLCWAANSLEKVYGQSNMSFLTYTLPELSECDLKSVQDHWSEIVNTVLIYLQRELKKHGCTTHIVGCTELQMERYESSGSAYPHLHLVFRGRFHHRSHWLISPKRFRDIWRRSVGRFLSGSKYDWTASENVAQVRKSSGGYLAKYISKCGSKHGMADMDLWHPSDWIVCSRKLRGLYERLTVKGYDIGQALLALVREWKPSCGFKRPIEISSTAYGIRKIGEWGWLKGEFIAPNFAQLHAI